MSGSLVGWLEVKALPVGITKGCVGSLGGGGEGEGRSQSDMVPYRNFSSTIHLVCY